MHHFFSHSEKETQEIAKQFTNQLKPGTIVAFQGELGAGKTTFIKQVIHACTKTPIEEIQSPTFTYLNSYEGDLLVHHFDLYRLQAAQNFLDLGFLEYLEDPNALVLIEWSEKIETLLDKDHYKLTILYSSLNTRKITIQSNFYENV